MCFFLGYFCRWAFGPDLHFPRARAVESPFEKQKIRGTADKVDAPTNGRCIAAFPGDVAPLANGPKLVLFAVCSPPRVLLCFLAPKGSDLWLQGMITLETLFVEYRADVHVFDHLVHERFHYQVRDRRSTYCCCCC